jgi:CubicO group peptidase (beta-lactamase class C family)
MSPHFDETRWPGRQFSTMKLRSITLSLRCGFTGRIKLARLMILVLCLVSPVLAQNDANERAALNFWPGKDWPVATPESQSMSSARLDVIKERLAAKKTRAFLVVRNDRVVYEWYAPGVTATTKQGTASLAKALVGGMSLAVAITDGKISLDDPAAKFVPQWKDDPRTPFGISARTRRDFPTPPRRR